MTAKTRPHMLFHRATEFRAPVRCSTNIYAELFHEAGADVSYMQGVVHLGHLLTGKGQARSFRRGPRRDAGCWVFTPCFTLPFMRTPRLYTPRVADLAYQACLPSIRSQLLASGFGEPDVIWTVPPGSGALRKLFPRAVLVFQVVDYYPAFSPIPTHALETSDYARADHVFLIGEALREHVAGLGVASDKITVLGQGVFAERFRNVEPPDALRDLPGPRAVWSGVLGKCDPALMTAAASEMHERGGSLVLIGEETPWARELRSRFARVHLTGPLRPEEVARYLAHCDVGLMLYDRARLEVYKGQNPLKLYEYAAAGLSIVSTPHDEFRQLSPPVLEITEVSEVTPAIARCLGEREARRDASLRFAERHDWRACHAKAQAVIDRLLSSRTAASTARVASSLNSSA